MNKSERLKALLERGYFPEELPPPFTTVEFAKYRSSISGAWPAAQNSPRSTAEIYNVPRNKGRRRDLSVVNPVAQFFLCKLISENWNAIRSHIKSNSLSLDDINISKDDVRAVPSPDFASISQKQSEISSLYNYALSTDISRFYSTLYTHAIPWALHGKVWCKENLTDNIYKSSLGARLDAAVRKGNDNQTIGIPVGPDTSRIISEIVAVSIDRIIIEKLALNQENAVRNVDDLFVGFDTLARAEDAAAISAIACREFQLESHPDKTAAKEMPWFNEPPWPLVLSQITFSKSQKKQLSDIRHFFTLALDFQKKHPDDNVLNYAVKVTSSSDILSKNWSEYETFLLRVGRSNHTTIPSVVKIFTNYNLLGAPLNKPKISKFIKDLIVQCSPLARHSEVAWALFLAKALKVKVEANWLEYVVKMDSSVCALIALDLRSRGLILGNIDTSLWESALTTEGLNSSMWLLAYEAKLKGWLNSATPDYVDNHPHFKVLLDKKISFYNPKKNVQKISPSKKKIQTPSFAPGFMYNVFNASGFTF